MHWVLILKRTPSPFLKLSNIAHMSGLEEFFSVVLIAGRGHLQQVPRGEGEESSEVQQSDEE